MNTARRGRKILALAAASAVIFAACGSDDDGGSGAETTDSGSETTEAPDGTEAPDTTDETTETTDGGEEGAGEAVFRITYELSDNAVWNDGTPIMVADFQCGMDAALNTPGSLSTAGYDSITSISEGDRFLPAALIMMSFLRSISVSDPSGSRLPTSPVCSQPSMMVSAVALGLL